MPGERQVTRPTPTLPMRRVWRLGQKSDVEVDFLCYRGTMEQEILSRMGKKMKYAQMLYGKDAEGVLVDNTEEDDIARAIIADALEGHTFKDIVEVVKDVKIFGTSKSGRVKTSAAPVPMVKIPDLIPTLKPVSAVGSKTIKNPKEPKIAEQPVLWAEPGLLFSGVPAAEAFDEAEPMQLGLFGDAVPVSQVKQTRGRGRGKVYAGQLMFAQPLAGD